MAQRGEAWGVRPCVEGAADDSGRVALDLRVGDFTRLLRSPRGPLVGLAAQFLVLPAATFVLTMLLRPGPSIALGMLLMRKGEAPVHVPTRAREVFDVSGAGDTVIATCLLAVAGGASFLEAAELANYAAGIVVAKLGTATCTPDELLAVIP